MPVSSPSSRVFLGVVFTVAVALVVIVACSGPSIPPQDQLLLLSIPAERLPATGPLVRPTPVRQESNRSAAPVRVPALVPSPEPLPEGEPALSRAAVESQRPPGSDVGTLPHQLSSAAGAWEAVAEDRPAWREQDLDGSSGVDARTPQALLPAAVDPAGPTSEAEAGLQAEVQEEAPRKEPAAKRQEEAGGKPAEGDRREPDAQAKPLQRLSREFARRRAADEGDRESTTDILLPPRHVAMPKVVMSQEHRQSCLVFVGEEMPDALPLDAEGKPHSIRQALGKQFTVVLLWDAANPYALDQFEELSQDLAGFTTEEVKTIAIHVGPAPENYQQLCDKSAREVLCLVDPARNYFAKVALKKLPRTYVLDAAGKIIWLDIEYSRTTRYELRNALEFSLQNNE